MSNAGYVLRRSLQALIVIAIVYTFTFFILFVLPGDPLENKITNPVNPLPSSTADALRAYYGFDQGPVAQFFAHLGRLFTGDLGFSLVNGRAVSDLIGQALGETIVLAGLALLFTAALSSAVALTAVFAPWRWVREAARGLPVLSISAPSFLVGYLLLAMFSFQFGWVSSIRDQGLASFVLPALTLAFASSGTLSQVLIQGLTGASRQPFVAVLEAKGVSGIGIVLRHILKNGAIPSLTLLALVVGDLLAGAVVVETIFNRHGLGYFTYTSVRDQDTPVIVAIVLLVSVVYIAINLATDLLYVRLDPRIGQSLIRAGTRRRAPRLQQPEAVPA
ncbi:ABC transporter permease [Microbacterium sp. SORGH_AS_0862]|uniref:ABC transporter permease n=1 Tax=Microbacterium sp. SORGH_AS_0862 TaxID=3041789 RepID=UPI002792BC29|nr:ABC transporter permease [Microbacterium sp. SORGH_AS_0862]MDQ1205335.1 peptide/nickel transport system permease protein [Microbacterium sp. SORGH_AS_0862]